MNKKVMAEISEIKQKQRVIEELQEKFSNSLAMCKEVYMEIRSSLQVELHSYI